MRGIVGGLTIVFGVLGLVVLSDPAFNAAITPPLEPKNIVGLSLAAATLIASGVLNVITWLNGN